MSTNAYTQLFAALLSVCSAVASLPALAQGKPPVFIGLNLEFSHKTSNSDDAILLGTQIAVDEINRAGRVLGGRPLAILEKDDRADQSGSIPGTGLGLALMREIMEIHHGGVELQSKFGIGTTVTLWLPVKDTVSSERLYTEKLGNPTHTEAEIND